MADEEIKTCFLTAILIDECIATLDRYCGWILYRKNQPTQRKRQLRGDGEIFPAVIVGSKFIG